MGWCPGVGLWLALRSYRASPVLPGSNTQQAQGGKNQLIRGSLAMREEAIVFSATEYGLDALVDLVVPFEIRCLRILENLLGSRCADDATGDFASPQAPSQRK